MENIPDSPTVTELAIELLAVSVHVETDMIDPGCDEPSIDVRLRLHGGSWYLMVGDSSYDQDHRGYWGASSVGYDLPMDDAKDIALDLIDQALDDHAQSA